MGTHVFDKLKPNRPKPDGTLPEAQTAQPPDPHPEGPFEPSYAPPEGTVLAHEHPVATGEAKPKEGHYK